MINFSINKAYSLQALNTTKEPLVQNAIPILSTIKIDVTSEGITSIGSNDKSLNTLFLLKMTMCSF